jgi:hypothetical protein
MKRFSILSIILGIISIVANAQSQYTKNITIESVKSHIDTLASESMKGRDTGSEGQKMAAQYIAGIFEKSELKPVRDSDYFSQFKLYSYKNGYSTMGDNQETKWDCYYSGSRNIKDSISIELIFAGYGNESDLKGLNTDGKMITIIADNARAAIDKINKIAKIDTPNYFLVALPAGQKKFKSEEMINFDTFFSLIVYGLFNAEQMKDSASFAEFFNTYNLFNDLKIESDKDIRVFFIHQENLSRYFGKPSEELIELAKKNNESNQNTLSQVKGSIETMKIDFAPEKIVTQTENVLGFIEGSEKKDEFVIVCGHYDHVGENYRGQINYGADDNASGTGAVLELAKQFAQAKKDGIQFKRSILFLTVSAEEKGLYGSQAFVDNPPIPLKNVNLVINLDMIGRNRENDDKYNNTVFVAAWEGGKKYKRITKKENKNNTNLKVDFTPGLYHKMVWRYSSDHYPFVQKDVPALVFFTGLHPDYHTPRDTPDLINYDKYHRIVQLVFETTWEVVNK